MNIFQELSQRECWLKLIYPDKSVRIFKTTLNPEILNMLDISDRENLYDTVSLKPIPLEDLTVCEKQLFYEKPNLEVLDEFVNRFIK